MRWHAGPVLGTLFVLCLAALVYTIKDAARADQARLEALAAEVREAQDRARGLAAEIALLESPDRLGRLGRERLGLVPVDPWRVVTLDEAPLLLEAGPAGQHLVGGRGP